MPTPRNICPLTMTIVPAAQRAVLQPSEAPPADTTHASQCIGPQCHLWRFDPGMNPLDGDCTFNIACNAVTLVANLAQQAWNAGAKEAVEEQGGTVTPQ